MKIRRLGLFSLVCASFVSLEVAAQNATFQGTAVTGINRRLGEPVFDLGAPFGTIGFETVGAFDPGAPDAAPLTPASPGSTLLATTVDPLFLAVFGVPPADPALLNVPLRDVGVIVGPDGTRAPIADLAASPQFSVGRAPSNGAITLGSWLRAEGRAKVRCQGRDAPFVELDLKGLVPRGLYTAWGGMLTAGGPAPIPLGGVPNVFTADDAGQARYTARLNYCPLALKPGEIPLAFIDIVLHTDHAAYGGVPEPFAAGLPPGVVSHIHVEFAISATPVP